MQKPDFTGTWKFNSNKSKLQIQAPDASVFVIDHREPVFRMSRIHTFGEKSDTFSLELTTDGVEVTIEHTGLHLRARAYWDGITLVFDSKLARGGEEASNIVRYKLNDSNDIFIGEERFRSKSLNYDNIWVLDKQ